MTPKSEPDPTLDAWKAAKYGWLLETMARQRALAPHADDIVRRGPIGTEDFLAEFYAPGRPVILQNMISTWPALRTWSWAYLRRQIGGAMIECQAGRDRNARFELDKDNHKKRLPFDLFMDKIGMAFGNDLYLTAYNSAQNERVFEPLAADVGRLDSLLDQSDGNRMGMLWIGPQGTFTPLHHDLTNNLIVQVVGRKRLVMAAPAETPNLYNNLHVFSDISDLKDPGLDPARYPLLKKVRLHEIILEPGDILFVPVGWWHQVEALDFSVTMTYTNFRWPNNAWQTHPAR